MYVCICIGMYVSYVCMYACVCVYVCVCVSVCVCSNLVPVDIDFTKSHAPADGRVIPVRRARKL